LGDITLVPCILWLCYVHHQRLSTQMLALFETHVRNYQYAFCGIFGQWQRFGWVSWIVFDNHVVVGLSSGVGSVLKLAFWQGLTHPWPPMWWFSTDLEVDKDLHPSDEPWEAVQKWSLE
jgi:hypothetical protein